VTEKNLIAGKAPRDVSGSQSYNRLEYQKHWAISLILATYEKRKDFVVLIDYHDDVARTNSEDVPTSCEFYQVKTKETGAWSIPSLLSRTKGAKLSIIGKLGAHKAALGVLASKSQLVSNVPLSATLQDSAPASKLAEIELCSLDHAERARIEEALANELGVSDTESILTTLSYFKSTLSLHGYSTQIQGEMVEFFEKVAPGASVSVRAFYRVLSDQLSRRFCDELLHLEWEELKKKKGISRSELESLIAIALQPQATEKYQLAIDRLQHESIDLQLLFGLQACAKSIELELRHGTNRILQKASEVCAELIPTRFRDNTMVSLVEFIEEQSTSIIETYPELRSLDRAKLYLLIIRSING